MWPTFCLRAAALILRQFQQFLTVKFPVFVRIKLHGTFHKLSRSSLAVSGRRALLTGF